MQETCCDNALSTVPPRGCHTETGQLESGCIILASLWNLVAEVEED